MKRAFDRDLSGAVFRDSGGLFYLLAVGCRPIRAGVSCTSGGRRKGMLIIKALIFSLIINVAMPSVDNGTITGLYCRSVRRLGPMFVKSAVCTGAVVLSGCLSHSGRSENVICMRAVKCGRGKVSVVGFEHGILMGEEWRRSLV